MRDPQKTALEIIKDFKELPFYGKLSDQARKQIESITAEIQVIRDDTKWSDSAHNSITLMALIILIVRTADDDGCGVCPACLAKKHGGIPVNNNTSLRH